MSWNGLPPELRLPILQTFAANNHPLACYATINKEWQGVIESETFKSLTITLDSMFEFTEHFSEQTRRQCSLKHIHLSIGKPWPDLSRSPDELDIIKSNVASNTADFSKAIPLLFAFLEQWDAQAVLRKRDGGICLEISVPYVSSYLGGAHRDADEIHLDAGFTYFSATKDADRMSPGGLPVVKVITEFNTLRRNLSNISHKTMFDIIVSLPNLTRVHFERRFQYENFSHEINEIGAFIGKSNHKPGNRRLVEANNLTELARHLPMWPDSIKSIEIVQEHEDPVGYTNHYGPTFARLGAVVASHSFKLEELAVCHQIEADDFFKEAKRLQVLQPQPWNNLLFLTLTSDCLSRNPRITQSAEEDTQGYAQKDNRLNSLLQDAGEAAKLMPVLRRMQLLNGSLASCGIFKYEAANGNATVGWAGTWQFKLADRVRQAWGEVAQQNNFELQILPEEYVWSIQDHSDYIQFFESRLASREPALQPRLFLGMRGLMEPWDDDLGDQ